MTNAGTGPYRQEAWLAAAVVWVLIAAIVSCACAVLTMAFTWPAPAVRRWQVIAIVVCAIGLAGVWLLTFIMVGRSDGDMNVLSPGLLSLTAGVGLAIALWRLVETFPNPR